MDNNKNNNQKPNNDEFNIDNILNSANDKSSFFTVVDDEKPLEADTGNKNVTIDQAKEKSMKKRRNKKKRKLITSLFWVLGIIIIAGAISAFALMAFFDISGITFSEAKEYDITIPEGSSTEDIANILKDAGAIEHPLIFRLYSKLKGEDGKYQYGYYTVTSSSGYEGIIGTLQTVGATAEEKEITIPEGSGIRDIIAIFEDNGLCTKSEFLEAMNKSSYNYDFVSEIPTGSVYYRFEGYLFPDTYKFAYVKDEGVNNAKRAISKMLSVTDERVFTDENIAKAKKLGHSMHEVLTMASIVQLEAGGSPDNMAKVAQVFYNRLNWDDANYLGSTPTANYPDKRYNTNVGYTEGLPPGPLDSPSLNAVLAAVDPDKTVTATYFVTDKNSKFYYTNSLSEHNSIIQSLKNQGLWEY